MYNMNPLKTKNQVAKILQIYACVNAVAGLIFSCTIGDEIAIIIFAITLIASFLIYALGEIIELLNQIKENTSNKHENIEEIPEI